jgi:hypothetical protein
METEYIFVFWMQSHFNKIFTKKKVEIFQNYYFALWIEHVFK